ncbi:MAG: prepilin-type N-terminal cleavage/methylation domain-containing protein [Verrucomicrobiota bacterium]
MKFLSYSNWLKTLRARRGLTLVELLVVLSIIAVLSTVALRSMVGVLDQTNYEANLTQLQEVEIAVLGDEDVAGFLGDIGRLPQIVGSIPETQLSELWDPGLSSYSINTPSGDSEVRLGTGWRGPYLNLGLTRSDLTDGFGRPFVFYQADGSNADDPGESIAAIQSLGASGTTGGVDYEEDVTVIFQDSTSNLWQSDLMITVVRDSSNIELADGANLIVRAYGANGSGGIHTVVEEKLVITSDLPSQDFTLSDLPHGAKVLRAYQDNDNPSTKDTAITTTSSERKSPATTIVLGRLTGTITLTLY